MIRPSTHVSLGLGDASYHPAAMSSSAAGDVIQTEMMKIHQWKMSTKMELENKENRLQLSKETIAYQTQELGRMQKINDHIGRQHSAKCEDLRKLKDEVETKTAQLQMVEQGVVQLRNTVAKQEKALGKAEKRDGITFAAVEDLALKFETCRGNKKKLEAATDRVLQSGKEIEVLENQKAELAKQLLEVGARLEASRTDLVEREEVIVQREREVDSYKALRHRELKEKSEELEALQSRCDTLDAEKAQMAEELQARQEEFTADQENVERERDEVKGENGRLAKQLCKADEELGQRIVELADEKIKIATLKENLADVTKNFAQTLQEKKEIGDILEASRKRIKDLENETADMKRYEEDIDMLRADFTASLDSLNKQQDEIQKLRKFQVENFTLQESVKKLSQKLHQKEDSANTAEGDLAQKDETIDNLKALALTKEQEITKLESAQQFIMQQHDTNVQRAADRFRTELKKKDDAFEELQNKLQEAESKVPAAADKKLSAAEASRFKTELVKKDSAIAGLQKKLQEAEKRVPSAADKKSAVAEANRLKTELMKKDDAIADLQKKLQETEKKGPVATDMKSTEAKVRAPRAANAKKTSTAAKTPADERKRRLMSDTESSSDVEEGKLFEDFFATKPKKTYEKKNAGQRKFFKHLKPGTIL